MNEDMQSPYEEDENDRKEDQLFHGAAQTQMLTLAGGRDPTLTLNHQNCLLTFLDSPGKQFHNLFEFFKFICQAFLFFLFFCIGSNVLCARTLILLHSFLWRVRDSNSRPLVLDRTCTSAIDHSAISSSFFSFYRNQFMFQRKMRLPSYLMYIVGTLCRTLRSDDFLRQH